MNFKDLKQWEQLDCEIEFWEGVVENGGEKQSFTAFPLCSMHKSCKSCPLQIFIGNPCCHGTPLDEYFKNKTPQTAQAMVDRLVEIRNKLHRLDR